MIFDGFQRIVIIRSPYNLVRHLYNYSCRVSTWPRQRTHKKAMVESCVLVMQQNIIVDHAANHSDKCIYNPNLVSFINIQNRFICVYNKHYLCLLWITYDSNIIYFGSQSVTFHEMVFTKSLVFKKSFFKLAIL